MKEIIVIHTEGDYFEGAKNAFIHPSLSYY